MMSFHPIFRRNHTTIQQKATLRVTPRFLYLFSSIALMLFLFSACGNPNGNFDPSTGAPLPPTPFSQGVTIASYVVMVLFLIVPAIFLRKLLKGQPQHSSEQVDRES